PDGACVVSAFRRTYTGVMSKIVAVIGASGDRNKFGNRAVRAFRQQGYTVIPINPREKEIEGLTAYASVLDVPGPIDMASLYVPPDVGEQVIAEIARKGIPEVWLNPGAESDGLIARARDLQIQPIVACSIVAIGENPKRLKAPCSKTLMPTNDNPHAPARPANGSTPTAQPPQAANPPAPDPPSTPQPQPQQAPPPQPQQRRE